MSPACHRAHPRPRLTGRRGGVDRHVPDVIGARRRCGGAVADNVEAQFQHVALPCTRRGCVRGVGGGLVSGFQLGVPNPDRPGGRRRPFRPRVDRHDHLCHTARGGSYTIWYAATSSATGSGCSGAQERAPRLLHIQQCRRFRARLQPHRQHPTAPLGDSNGLRDPALPGSGAGHQPGVVRHPVGVGQRLGERRRAGRPPRRGCQRVRLE